MSKMAINHLLKEKKRLDENPSTYCSCGLINDDPLHWRVTIIGQPNTPYADCFLPCELNFPHNYPMMPPAMRFLCPMWHPNIDAKTGKVCISILHPPGPPTIEYPEPPEERWLPAYGVESIIVAVVSMLDDPNLGSPLNVEAGRDYRTDKKKYIKKTRQMALRGIDYAS